MNNDRCIIFGLREIDCSSSSGESQITPAVLWMNIHKNPPNFQSMLVISMMPWRHSQVHPKFSLALQHVPKCITITPMVLLSQSTEISVTPKADQNALLGFDSLLKLMLLSLHSTSAKNISDRAEWLREGGCAPSEPSETPLWRITPRPASIPRVALHIALRSPFCRFFSLCRSPIVNKHSGVVANSDHTSKWVHWVHACIWNTMQWVTLQKSLLTLLLHYAWGAWEEGDKIWYYLALRIHAIAWIHKISGRGSETKSWERSSEYFCYMRRWDENEMLSIYPGVPRIYTPRRAFQLCYPCISVHPLSHLNDILGGRDRSSWEMHWEAVIEWVWRCTWRPRWRELRDARGGRDWASLEMHLEAEIEWTQKMHLEADRVFRCTLRLWPSKFGDGLAGDDGARLEEYLKAVDLEGGATAAESLCIG